MNKQTYKMPQVSIINIQATSIICESTGVKAVGGNAGFNPEIKAGSETARGRGVSDWDDED